MDFRVADILDYEIDEATWGRKKKPYRYRWPDPVRDEVLARLLALNAERASAEARSGATTTRSRPTSNPHPGRPMHRRKPAFPPSLMVQEPKPLRPSDDD